MSERTVRDFAADVSLALFSAAAIAMVGLGYPVQAGIYGLLSELPYAYFAWKLRSWALWGLIIWWSAWWGKILIYGTVD